MAAPVSTSSSAKASLSDAAESAKARGPPASSTTMDTSSSSGPSAPPSGAPKLAATALLTLPVEPKEEWIPRKRPTGEGEGERLPTKRTRVEVPVLIKAPLTDPPNKAPPSVVNPTPPTAPTSSSPPTSAATATTIGTVTTAAAAKQPKPDNLKKTNTNRHDEDTIPEMELAVTLTGLGQLPGPRDKAHDRTPLLSISPVSLDLPGTISNGASLPSSSSSEAQAAVNDTSFAPAVLDIAELSPEEERLVKHLERTLVVPSPSLGFPSRGLSQLLRFCVEARKAILAKDKKPGSGHVNINNLFKLVVRALNAGFALQLDLNEFENVYTLNYDASYLYRRQTAYFPDLTEAENEELSDYDQMRLLRHFLGFAVTRLQTIRDMCSSGSPEKALLDETLMFWWNEAQRYT